MLGRNWRARGAHFQYFCDFSEKKTFVVSQIVTLLLECGVEVNTRNYCGQVWNPACIAFGFYSLLIAVRRFSIVVKLVLSGFLILPPWFGARRPRLCKLADTDTGRWRKRFFSIKQT